MRQAGLEGIEFRVPDARVVIVIGKGWPYWTTRAAYLAAIGERVGCIFAEWSTPERSGGDSTGAPQRLDRAPDCWDSRVHNEQVMGLGADVSQAQQRDSAELPSDGNELVLVVLVSIPRWRRRHSGS